MKRALPLGAVLLGFVGGCVPPDADPVTSPGGRKVEAVKPAAPAGLPVTVSADPNLLKGAIARANRFGRRSDPFQLLPDEVRFEKSQSVERLLTEQGSFNLEYQEPIPPEPGSGGAGSQPEAQPYRRLSGVVIGDAIVGILETLGQPSIIIRPGQYIPNTEWRVVLINEDRAVLRRAGTRQPREISVKLELPPPGFETGAGDGGRGAGPPGAAGAPGGPGGRGSLDGDGR